MIKNLETGQYSNGVGANAETCFVPFERGKIFESEVALRKHLKYKLHYPVYNDCAVIKFDLRDLE